MTEDIDPLHEDEPGYRIHQREYALPDISFEPDELAVLGLASRTWAQASLAGPAAQALRKLRAAGVERDVDALIGIEPRLRTTEPAFDAVKDGVLRRLPLRFAYRSADSSESAQNGTSSRGRCLLARPLVPQRLTTPTAARPGCSGSPASSATYPGRPATPAPSRCRPTTSHGAWSGQRAARRPAAAGGAAGAHRSRAQPAPARPAPSARSTRPGTSSTSTTPTPTGSPRSWPATAPTSSWSNPTSWSRRRRRLQRRRRRARGRPLMAARPRPARPRPRGSPGCSRWCPGC